MQTVQPPRKLIFLLAFAVATMVANIYYPQPILALLAESLGMRADAAGLVMTMTQAGYGLGVLFVVPLGDLFENKKLILIMIAVTILAEFTLGFSRSVIPYAMAAVTAGVGAATVQLIVPYATHLFAPKIRGQVIGSLMSGLMLGIMLSRPIASLLTDFVGLHAVFYLSAAMMAVLVCVLYFVLPSRRPDKTEMHYGQLLWSMKTLLFETATLRRRAAYQGMMFGSFCVFWTTVPLLLLGSPFNFSQKGVAIFALAGLAGAVVAPFAGRMADKGHSRKASILAFTSGMLCFALGHFLPGNTVVAVIFLALIANLLDAGVAAHLVLGQRAIFMIDPANQARLNGLYVGIIYVGGAVGSAVGAWAFLHGGWGAATAFGFIFPLGAMLLLLTEKFFGYSEDAV